MEYTPDPKQDWNRMNFDESISEQLRRDKKFREIAELETNRDLKKYVQQLVCDVHEEIHDPNRTELQNLASAQKRMVSLMARVALSNDRVAKRMEILTWAITVMTLAIV